MKRKYKVAQLLSIGAFYMCIAIATGAQYPAFERVPASLRSPSGERAQIQVEGIVTKISFFHGRNDDEADWHVYVDLHPGVRTELRNYIRSLNPDLESISHRIAKHKANDISTIYSEVMVLDDYKNSMFDEKFLTADVSKAFLLSLGNSRQPAWDLAMRAVNDQGENKNFTDYSGIRGKYVYLQGAFVNDKEHGFLPEIHPLDGIAFAMDTRGEPVSIRHTNSAWPAKEIRWRVCYFANSSFHRINGESYLKRERTTTFYLELPRNAYRRERTQRVAGEAAPTGSILVTRHPVNLWDAKGKNEYAGRGWSIYPQHEIAVDPRDGRKKLKVTGKMKLPNKAGGIVVCDYVVRVTDSQPIQSIRN